MGNKRTMLGNGLGHALEDELIGANRFFDLFTGSGSVARHVSSRYPLPVHAADLQRFAAALADSVISRTDVVGKAELGNWQRHIASVMSENARLKDAQRLQNLVNEGLTPEVVTACRNFSERSDAGPIEAAYGGHYFSPLQAIYIDTARRNLPDQGGARKVALAALIEGASSCAAAPGHTAQPFQPTETAIPYLREAWLRPIDVLVGASFASIGGLTALKVGTAAVGDALMIAETLEDGDVVFIDPPYSAVHYSRFYHVLETISSGTPISAIGRGRYPDASERPRSEFSMRGQASGAFGRLLQKVATRGARAVVTFPAELASNNVSGDDVAQMCGRYFAIEQQIVTGKFSTLGGNLTNRSARQTSKELILRLKPL